MISYDDALPNFAHIVQKALAEDDISQQIFLRDANGRLTFVKTAVLSEPAEETILTGAKRLAPWVDPSMPIIALEDMLEPPSVILSQAFPEYIESSIFTGYLRVIERRLVGQDWLRYPADPEPGLPPIVVFASHKGGVGRSTALSIAAHAISDQGHNVLVIDLDLEAPGLGTMLLSDADLPEGGALDFFVETSIQNSNRRFAEKIIASRTNGRGIIHVVPATGKKSHEFPQNVLGKIARAYLETIDDENKLFTFLDRTRQLVKFLCDIGEYDVILIDSRAGLNEATAASMLGLGANILLFGVNTPQTFSGYRFLLSYLSRFRPEKSGENDWRARLRMVQARAQLHRGSEKSFRDRAYDLFSDTLYDEEEGIDVDAFNYDYDDSAAPHYAWAVAEDSNYSEFDPRDHPEQLAQHLYERGFGVFIKNLIDLIGLNR